MYANLSVVVYEVRLSQKNLLHDVMLRVGGQITLVLFPRIIFRSLTGGKSGSKRTSKVLTLSRLKEIQIIHCPRRHQSYIGWRQVNETKIIQFGLKQTENEEIHVNFTSERRSCSRQQEEGDEIRFGNFCRKTFFCLT